VKAKSETQIVEDYLLAVSADKKDAVEKLRTVILKNIPKGFEECINYGMLGYVVPHKLYPAGYHCNPKLPLAFASLAAQKNAISLHHMGLYANPLLLTWFVDEYAKHSKVKLDMGKGCVRFKKMDDIPYKLIGELFKKLSVKDWITLYEKSFTKK
jgi:uncharacterized protein YdhG (YjbR/CyaY superfamily)